MMKKFLVLLTIFSVGFTLTGCKDDTEPETPEINQDYTDALEMDFSYQDQDFLPDGIGEVSLLRCVDGDTAVFTEGGQNFSVRFLGIDTPESTSRFDAWGKAASTYTCNKLENALTIVLEHDTESTRTDGNERYLSWVWYDGRLLNLELVEEAYTGSKGVSGLKYQTVFYEAEFKTQDTDRRIWGEIDPDYDYSLDGVQITIEELVTNQEEYVGNKVVIRGFISRTIDGHPYLQDGDYGIYLYSGFSYTTKLAVGNEVLISALTLTYYPDVLTGAVQLTGFNRKNIEVLSTDNVVSPVEIELADITINNVGSLVKFTDLEVVSIYENSYDDAFTVTAKDSSGNTITIRRDKTVDETVTASLFPIGATFDLTGPMGRYNSEYQIMIVSIDDLEVK